jgi:hypothetical protein
MPPFHMYETDTGVDTNSAEGAVAMSLEETEFESSVERPGDDVVGNDAISVLLPISESVVVESCQ